MCVSHCRSLHQLPSDGRGDGEQEQAAAAARLGDRRSGLGHLQTGPVHAAADSAPGTPHLAAVPHPPRQVEKSADKKHEHKKKNSQTIGKARKISFLLIE